MLQGRQIVVQPRAQPHDVCRVSEIPSWPPFVLQRSDAPAKEIGAYHLYSEPGSFEAVNPGGRDCELLIFRIKGAPVIAAHHFCHSGLAEIWEVNVLDPAPFPAPLIPLQMEQSLKINVHDPGDPSDATREGICLNAWSEIMAEEGYTGYYSNKVFIQMREDSHTGHGVGGEV